MKNLNKPKNIGKKIKEKTNKKKQTQLLKERDA